MTREQILEDRINELEGFLESFSDSEGIKEILLKGENFVKCDMCGCLLHNDVVKKAHDRNYCECCYEEI